MQGKKKGALVDPGEGPSARGKCSAWPVTTLL
jgi:hypothetical protein